MCDQVVIRIKKDLYKTNSISSIQRLVRILDYSCSYFFEENPLNEDLPWGDEIFNLFKEILVTPMLYNKNGTGAFFDFLYLGNLKKIEKEILLSIIYKNFNDYPDYNNDNNFIFVLLLNIKFIYEITTDGYETFLYFMAGLYLESTKEKKSFIEVFLLHEDLEKIKYISKCS